MSEAKKTESPQEARKREERAEMAQVLLNRPWVLKSDDSELFAKLKEHYESLRQWFQQMCGFTLLMTREMIKLEKVPGVAHPWMGFSEFTSIMDYCLFTYCLWYLEGKGEAEQFALSELVTEVKSKLKLHDYNFDENIYPHRLSLKRALKKLRELGALKSVDGDEEEWVHHYKDERKNVLYECTSVARFVLRQFAQDISQVTQMHQLGDGLYPNNQEGDIMRRRHHIFRRFVQEPVVLDNEWQGEERQYVLTQRSYILSQMQSALGLEGSRYREGLLFYYPHPKGEMALFPTAQSISDLALLLASQIREEQGELVGEVLLTRSDLEALLTRMKEKYQTYWSKKDREAKISELTEELLTHLEEWGLARRIDQQQLCLSPVLGRWTGSYRQKGEEES
jgi:uncharacterized protein (TIGR02678 family)